MEKAVMVMMISVDYDTLNVFGISLLDGVSSLISNVCE